MKQRRSIPSHATCALLLAAASASSAHAAIVPTNDVSPADPATWTNETIAFIGITGSGSLAIDAGTTLYAQKAYIGYGVGSTGEVNVNGLGSTWDVNLQLFVGFSGDGTLAISAGGTVQNEFPFQYVDSYLGYNWGSSGTVTIDGLGSAWNRVGKLCLGNFGNGTIAITNGGHITTGIGQQASYLGYYAGSKGLMNIDGNKSLWNIQNILYVANSGDATIALSHGGVLVTDSAVFIANNSGSTGTIIVDGAQSGCAFHSNIAVGYAGNGAISVKNGGTLLSGNAFLGYYADSNGTVKVDGPGSSWVSYELYLGYYGSGKLSISNGGQVSAYDSGRTGFLGYKPGSSAAVSVDGIGSSWSAGILYIGYYEGKGTLAVTNGGHVTSNTTWVGSGSGGAVSVDGVGSTWTGSTFIYVGNEGTLTITGGGTVSPNFSLGIFVGSSLLDMTIGDGSLVNVVSPGGELSNAGTIRLKAVPSAVAGTTYSPILANTWSGNGTVQPLGGTWNTFNHTFTPSTIATGLASQPLTVDRSQQQRLQLTNPQTNSTLIANVAPTTTSTIFSLTANPLTPDQAAQLQLTLPTGSPILSAWTLATTGYTTGDPVYLSLSLPTGLNAKQLALYRYTGTAWSLFSPLDFSCDGTYASFTTTDLLGFALSSTTPTLLGDATLDNKVDAFDLNLLAAHWQNPTGSLWQNGDFNADGKVDAFDLNLLAANWQAGLSPQASLASSPIPEPASLSLAAIAGTSLLIRRRQREAIRGRS